MQGKEVRKGELWQMYSVWSHHLRAPVPSSLWARVSNLEWSCGEKGLTSLPMLHVYISESEMKTQGGVSGHQDWS